MRYQQTPVSRLARAGSKLEAGEDWAAVAGERGVYTRVQAGVLQRVRLENSETQEHLHLFEDFEPLPARTLKEGFREELCFRVADDHYEMYGMLVRVYDGWEVLAGKAAKLGVSVTFLGGNSLLCSISFVSWTREEVLRVLVLGKAFMKVASQLARDTAEGVSHLPAEVEGLLRAAYEVYFEDVQLHTGRRRRKKGDAQQSLFPDGEER